MPSILILGASYGSLFATKLLLAGHSVELVAPPQVAALVNREGTRVYFPLRGRAEPVEVDSRRLPGRLTAAAPADVDPRRHDLVVFAMQEPQFRAPDVRALLAAVTAAKRPCLSIMNMPPLPYLARIPGLATAPCRPCYADAGVWEAIDPLLLTHCSADPQAAHVPGRPENVIQVRLPSNFRAAQFEFEQHTLLLEKLARDIDAARLPSPDGPVSLPVRLRVHESSFVPLSKWPMLITGNYRCILEGGVRSIDAAVHEDPAASRAIYGWVLELLRRYGARDEDLVPFEAYSAAASSLTLPSSAARAIAGGAVQIERVDRLVQAVAAQKSIRLPALDALVAVVNARLAENLNAMGRRA
jgi:hypothetical protein